MKKLKIIFRNVVWRVTAFIVNFLIVDAIVIGTVSGLLPIINIAFFRATDIEFASYNDYNAIVVAPMIAVNVMILYLAYRLCCRICKYMWNKIKTAFENLNIKVDAKSDVKSDKIKEKDKGYTINEHISVVK